MICSLWPAFVPHKTEKATATIGTAASWFLSPSEELLSPSSSPGCHKKFQLQKQLESFRVWTQTRVIITHVVMMSIHLFLHHPNSKCGVWKHYCRLEKCPHTPKLLVLPEAGEEKKKHCLVFFISIRGSLCIEDYWLVTLQPQRIYNHSWLRPARVSVPGLGQGRAVQHRHQGLRAWELPPCRNTTGHTAALTKATRPFH